LITPLIDDVIIDLSTPTLGRCTIGGGTLARHLG